MSKKPLQKVIALINVLLILAFISSGCKQISSNIPVQTTQNGESHWFVDENGHFHTNNVKMAQKEIPFTIVVPDYIPYSFGNDYQYEITGPFENTLSNYIEVKIQYWNKNYQIFISEYNKKIVMLPTEALEPVSFEIAGIQVLRQITQFLTNSGTIEGLSFNWNNDELTFEVKIFNIPEKEGIKIVESMVKQEK